LQQRACFQNDEKKLCMEKKEETVELNIKTKNLLLKTREKKKRATEL
jgi:hypothetical protein